MSYDLRKLENRRSTILFEDMEISDAESDEYSGDATDDEWVKSAKLHGRKRKSKGDEHSNLEKIIQIQVQMMPNLFQQKHQMDHL